jgi:HEAT repeat-containing protein 5
MNEVRGPLLTLEMKVSLTAAHCAKTLIVAAGTGNVLLRQCTKFLIPGLIEYIAKVSPAVADGSVSETSLSAISEVWKAFASFFNSTPEALREFLILQLITCSS